MWNKYLSKANDSAEESVTDIKNVMKSGSGGGSRAENENEEKYGGKKKM